MTAQMFGFLSHNQQLNDKTTVEEPVRHSDDKLCLSYVSISVSTQFVI